jgi:hypothetical protein
MSYKPACVGRFISIIHARPPKRTPHRRLDGSSFPRFRTLPAAHTHPYNPLVKVLRLFTGGKGCHKEHIGHKGFHEVVFVTSVCFVADIVRLADGTPQLGNPLKSADIIAQRTVRRKSGNPGLKTLAGVPSVFSPEVVG